MSALAAFAAGYLAGVLTVVFLAIIGLRASGDRVHDFSNQDAERNGKCFDHSQSATLERERNNG